MEKLVLALFCKESQGILFYECGKRCSTEKYSVDWKEWCGEVTKHKINNVFVCPQAFTPWDFQAKEYSFCGCWEKSLYAKAPKCVAGQYCSSLAGILYYENGKTKYVKWHIWKEVMAGKKRIWMCPKAIEENGRIDNVQVWTQCLCWRNSHYEAR